jgi:hypothetical protein
MFRREVFDAVGGYRAACKYWEDLDLYLRMAARGRILVVPAPLYCYRFHAGSAIGGEIGAEEERATQFMLRCLAARRAGADYNALVPDERGGDRPGLSPTSLYLLAARRLWAGHSPGILRMLPRLRMDRPAPLWLGLLVLATVGDLSPRTVRWALRGYIRARDALAGFAIHGGKPVEWRFD